MASTWQLELPLAPAYRPARVPSRKRVDNSVLPRMLARLRQAPRSSGAPISAFIATTEKDPYRVLTGCILSLRTQDRVTAGAAARLFELAPDVETLASARVASIERAIYPVGFYRTKARRLVEIAKRLLAEHGGIVPDAIDALLELPGVGRKTANLVVTVAYRRPGICVDTHVHRITNRWGYVATRSPDETERRLRDVLPRRYWIELNALLVAFGQTVCRPTHPRCAECPVEAWCAKVGVAARRTPSNRRHSRVTVR